MQKFFSQNFPKNFIHLSAPYSQHDSFTLRRCRLKFDVFKCGTTLFMHALPSLNIPSTHHKAELLKELFAVTLFRFLSLSPPS